MELDPSYEPPGEVEPVATLSSLIRVLVDLFQGIKECLYLLKAALSVLASNPALPTPRGGERPQLVDRIPLSTGATLDVYAETRAVNVPAVVHEIQKDKWTTASRAPRAGPIS